MKRAGEEVRFGQNLKAVADSDDGTPFGGVFGDGFHDGRKTRDRSRAQVVAVAEAAGNDDDFRAAEVALFVPDEFGRLAEYVGHGVVAVVVAVRAGENDDGKFHQDSDFDGCELLLPSGISMRKSSITGLARSS